MNENTKWLELIQSRWADLWDNGIVSKSWKLPIQMSCSDGTALPLVFLEESKFGADLIRFDAGKWVALHTHVWDHILIVTKWVGILTFGKETFPLTEWMIYLVPWNVPHAIDATEELVLMAVWNNLISAESPDRLTIVKE